MLGGGGGYGYGPMQHVVRCGDTPVLEEEPAKLVLNENVSGPEEAVSFPEHVGQDFLNTGDS